MLIASYNVENLFERARALNRGTVNPTVLAAYAELNLLLERPSYDGVQDQILARLRQLGLLRGDESRWAWLRKIRGQLVRRPRTGPVTVAAAGRDDWIGWVELKTAPVDELAMQHTATVIRDLRADVLAVVEADNRPALARFSGKWLNELGSDPYEHVMLIDGNDDRGIDVGLLTRQNYRLTTMRSHVYDTDADGPVFSRDCAEYHLDRDGTEIVVLVNHFKSKGYGSETDPIGSARRQRQATRVAAIYEELRQTHAYVAVLGDLNDTPDSEALQPLLKDTDLTDIGSHPNFDWGPRTGTYGSGNEQIDYLLLSPALWARATGGGAFRKGIFHGPRVKNPWPMYDTLTSRLHQASDHAALWAEIDL